MKTSILIPVAVLLPLAVGCVDRNAQKQAKKTQEILGDKSVSVIVESSKSMDLLENLEVTGSITSSEQSNIGASVAGRLVSVFVHDGQIVRAGQAIAQQETEDLYARLRQAQSQASSARLALQQAQTDAHFGPTKTDSGVKSAEARLSQAKARLAKAKNGSRSEERTQAQWSVKRAKSDLDTAKIALDRANRLFEKGAIAKVEVEAADNRYQNALAAYQGSVQNLSMVESATRPEDLEAATLEVRVAEEALRTAKTDKNLDVHFDEKVNAARANLMSALEQVRLAQKALSDATIKSPFSGKVSGKPLQSGTFVAPGTSIATIVGDQGTYFEANVPESKISRIATGSQVKVTIDALQGRTYTGTVLAVNPLASGQGRLYTARIIINESGGIRPGMFARGQIQLGIRKGATVVPVAAVIRDGETAYLFTIANKKAKKQIVKTGLQNGDFLEIQGLATGEKVVTSGQSTIVDGSDVKVKEAEKGN